VDECGLSRGPYIAGGGWVWEVTALLGRRGPHAYLEIRFPVMKRGDGNICRKLSVVTRDKESM
jgi:hypothetical protein